MDTIESKQGHNTESALCFWGSFWFRSLFFEVAFVFCFLRWNTLWCISSRSILHTVKMDARYVGCLLQNFDLKNLRICISRLKLLNLFARALAGRITWTSDSGRTRTQRCLQHLSLLQRRSLASTSSTRLELSPRAGLDQAILYKLTSGSHLFKISGLVYSKKCLMQTESGCHLHI